MTIFSKPNSLICLERSFTIVPELISPEAVFLPPVDSMFLYVNSCTNAKYVYISSRYVRMYVLVIRNTDKLLCRGSLLLSGAGHQNCQQILREIRKEYHEFKFKSDVSFYKFCKL